MDVVFDHQIFSLQEYGGISRYFCELAARIGARAGYRATVVAGAHRNALLRARTPVRLVGGYVPPVAHTYRLRRGLNAALTSAYVHAARPHVVHETYYSAHAARLPAGTRRVVTVYDMIHERLAGEVPRGDTTAAAKAAAVARADHIVCISQRTQFDLIELLQVPETRTSVIHLGLDPAAWSASFGSETPRAAGERPFVLYVGVRSGYKNFAQVLRALALRPSIARAYRLVCVGGGELTAAEEDLIRSTGLPRHHVEQRDGNDADLADLYRTAAAFVYPSRYEGFGLPPLEAMACGCPVACSDTGSLPEIVGDAAELFDPDSAEAIAGSLDRILASPTRAAQLRTAGFRRAAQFTWARCADETLAAYRALV